MMAAGGSDGMDPRVAPGTVLWLDADQIPSVPTGTVVASWPNRFGPAGGADNDANPGRRPTYLVDGGHGKPGVYFGGANALGGSISLAADAGFSMYAAARFDTKPSFANVVLLTGAGGGGFLADNWGPLVVYAFQWNNPPGENRGMVREVYQPLGEPVILSMTSKISAPVEGLIHGQPSRVLLQEGSTPVTGSIDASTGYVLGGGLASGSEITGVLFDVVIASEWHPPAVRQAVSQFLANKNRVTLGG